MSVLLHGGGRCHLACLVSKHCSSWTRNGSIHTRPSVFKSPMSLASKCAGTRRVAAAATDVPARYLATRSLAGVSANMDAVIRRELSTGSSVRRASADICAKHRPYVFSVNGCFREENDSLAVMDHSNSAVVNASHLSAQLQQRRHYGVDIPRYAEPPKRRIERSGFGSRFKKPTRPEWKHYLLLIVPITTAYLGLWQIKRRRWKEGLLAELNEKTSMPVIAFPDDPAEIENLEYRRVRVRGTFDHENEILVGPRSKMDDQTGRFAGEKGAIFTTTKAGYHVFTPLNVKEPSIRIIVNRGWIPNSKRLAKNRAEGQIRGEVELVGIVRHTEERPTYAQGNVPEKGIWSHRDLDQMSPYLSTYPICIDAVYETTVPGGPIAGQTIIKLRNEHLNYAITCVLSDNWLVYWIGQTIIKLRNEHLNYAITWATLSTATSIMWLQRYVFPMFKKVK